MSPALIPTTQTRQNNLRLLGSPLKLHTMWSLSWFFLYVPSSGCTRPLPPIQTLSLPSAVLLPCHTLKSTMSSLLYRSYSYLLLLRKISPLKLISLESVALFPSSKFSLRMCTLSYLTPHLCTTCFSMVANLSYSFSDVTSHYLFFHDFYLII